MIQIQDLRERLIAHPLYAAVSDEEALRIFMRAHVFCVFDFMTLLKTLQRKLTCVEVPWLPPANREACRLVNEIVLGEESDLHPAGGYASHYDLYHEAMRACGADTVPIDDVLGWLRTGMNVRAVLMREELPPGVKAFVTATLDVVQTNDLHRIVAFFTLGREDVIPDMFRRLVQTLSEDAPERWQPFLYYLDRHIEVDGDQHGPMSHMLLKSVCGDDLRLWKEAEQAARCALAARIALWDAILAEIESGRAERAPAPRFGRSA